MGAVGIVVIFIVALLISPFMAAVVAWNVTDIINVGVNFWNVFWLALVGIFVVGGAKASSSG